MLEKSLYSQKTLFGQNDTFLIESEMFIYFIFNTDD